jgi:hypothetical protein
MKKIFFLLITFFSSFITFAQSGIMLPDGFIVPNLDADPTCTVAEKGKMYFNTISATLRVCNGTDWQTTSSLWNTNQAAPNTVNKGSGNVGIGTTTPQYILDVNGTARVVGSFYNTGGVSIGTTNSNSGLLIADGDIAISSTADAKTWKLDYNDANNNLSLQENGTARMIFQNGGNVGIGSVIPTAKLSVDGTGSFTGNLTVNSGKGIVRTTSANSLKTHIVPVSLGATFTISNAGCATTASQNITSAGFTTAPSVQVGNLVSGTGDFGKLIINVQTATTTGVVVRFCNNTTIPISLNNVIFNILCVGQ